MSNHVPFIDLLAHHKPLHGEILDTIEAVLESGAFAGGPFVESFEADFAAFCGTQHAVGVGSGTEALWFTLLALGTGPGDEVVTVPNSFIATAEAISFCGATPRFVDVDPDTLTLDPNRLETAINRRTKAIVPVHLFGQMADMDPIMAVADRHGIPVVEDACQAHGAEYRGRRAGSIGLAGCFSFYPGKNLGAFGEAGAVTTSDPELDEQIRVIRDHGQTKKYRHCRLGWNGRMDGIQGAVLRVKLRYLEANNDRRRAAAARYRSVLAGFESILPKETLGRKHIYHIFAVHVAERDWLLHRMHQSGICCAVHYPVPIHRQEPYKNLGHDPGSFPVCERFAGELLSLPMFPEITHGQIDAVAAALVSGLRMGP